MERFRRTAIGVLMIAVIAAGCWLWWLIDFRGRPHTLNKDQASIAYTLQAAGWVSPHTRGRIVYILSTRDCDACSTFESGAAQHLRAAGFDTRVIMVARPDLNGRALSTPGERALVAELWTNRDWSLYQRWMAAVPGWSPPDLRPADGDAARTAVIEAGRRTVDQLTPMLKHNGVKLTWPTAIWWSKAGAMRACQCDDGAAMDKAEKDMIG